MVSRDEQLRAIKNLRANSDFWPAIQQCGGDLVRVPVAYEKAVIDWLNRGGKDELKRRKDQAQTLRAALGIMAEYRDTLEHNIEGRVIHDPSTGKSLTLAPWLDPTDPVGAGPVLNTVAQVINQLADDLVNRNPRGITDRKDRDFFHNLGRRFREAELSQPPIAAMRRLYKTLMDSFYDDPKLAPDDESGEDANILHAFQRGFQQGL